MNTTLHPQQIEKINNTEQECQLLVDSEQVIDAYIITAPYICAHRMFNDVY
jgi:hypothetical protein